MNKDHLKILAASSLSLMSFCLNSYSTYAGVRDGGGGSLVSVDGKLEPADLHYNGQAEVIPSSYIPVKFNDYPKALEALQFAFTFLKERSVNGQDAPFSEWDVEDTEFYFVPKLSGDDLLPIESDLGEIQVAFTKDIVDPNNDPAIRPIVEILKGPFDQLSPDFQALVLLHELMHHKPYGQHTVISPIIKSLSVLLPLKHLQDQGSRNPLSDDELSASQSLEKLMSIFEHASSARKALRNGGGLLEGSVTDESKMFLGLSSSLSIQFNSNSSILNDTLIDSHVELMECGEFSENEFINSKVSFKCCALWANYGSAVYQPDSIKNNRFKNSTSKMEFDFFVGNFIRNTFENVTSDLRASTNNKGYTPYTFSDNDFRSVTSGREIYLNGSGNTLIQVQHELGRGAPDLMSILGDGNRLENVKIPLDGARIILGNKNTVTGLQDSAGGVLTLRDSVQIQNATYDNGPGEGCNTVLATGTVIKNQPVKCTPAKRTDEY